MRTYNISLILVHVFLLVACQLDDPGPCGMEIAFQVAGQSSTKAATITDNNNISSFVVCANTNELHEQRTGLAAGFNYYDYTLGMRMGNDWKLTPPQYWPLTQDATLDFYALSPAGSVNINSYGHEAGQVILDYTVPSANASGIVTKTQEDLLYAVKKEVKQTTNKVPLEFKHALAVVRIKAKNLTQTEIKVTKITIHGLYTSGKIDLNAATPTWIPTDGNKKIPNRNEETKQNDYPLSYTVRVPAAGYVLPPTNEGGKFTPLFSDSEGLFILPQDIAQGFDGYVEVTCTIAEQETKKRVPFPVQTAEQVVKPGDAINAELKIEQGDKWNLGAQIDQSWTNVSKTENIDLN